MEDNIIITKYNTHYGNMGCQVSKGGGIKNQIIANNQCKTCSCRTAILVHGRNDKSTIYFDA